MPEKRVPFLLCTLSFVRQELKKGAESIFSSSVSVDFPTVSFDRWVGSRTDRLALE
jgi:hypothetical protein